MSNEERCESVFPSHVTEEYYAFLRKLDVNAYTLPGPTVIFNAGVAAGLKLAAEGKTAGTPVRVPSEDPPVISNRNQLKREEEDKK